MDFLVYSCLGYLNIPSEKAQAIQQETVKLHINACVTKNLLKAASSLQTKDSIDEMNKLTKVSLTILLELLVQAA
jgi:hypothetical protein